VSTTTTTTTTTDENREEEAEEEEEEEEKRRGKNCQRASPVFVQVCLSLCVVFAIVSVS